MIYVDNGVFASCTLSLAGAAQQRAAEILAEAGLPVHEVSAEAGSHDTLGLSVEHRIARAKPARRWRLLQSTEEIKRNPFLSGKQLEVIIDHFTFLFCYIGLLFPLSVVATRLLTLTRAGTVIYGSRLSMSWSLLPICYVLSQRLLSPMEYPGDSQ